jgi:NitT/TauT family transport system substrate-binding protein
MRRLGWARLQFVCAGWGRGRRRRVSGRGGAGGAGETPALPGRGAHLVGRCCAGRAGGTPALPGRLRALALLAPLALSACAPASAPPAAPPAAAPTAAGSGTAPAAAAPTAGASEPAMVSLKLSYTVPGGIYTPLYVAETEGIFRKEGLDAELLLGGTGPRTAQALIGGDVQLASTGSLTVPMLQGSELVYVAGSANYFVSSIYARPEYTRLDDLRGKTVGANGPYDASHLAMRVAFARLGWDPDHDVEYSFLGGQRELVAGMLQGVIAAGDISPPTSLEARNQGLHEVLNVADLKLPFVQNAVGTSRPYLRDHPEVVRRFLRAYVEGIKLAKAQPDAAMAAIGKYTKTENPAVLREVYDTYVNVWERVPRLTLEALQGQLDALALTTPEASTARPDQLVDQTLLDELDRSGFVDSLYR